ncbi:MAG TPA: hypothetical protein VFG78_11945 [Gemmatimonadota bacterium]|nr:hypothetical protein [Gemmatimonadota bacterium]
MLRITPIASQDNRVALQVEGRIVGEDTLLLERECWAIQGGGSSVRLDLAGVRYVDRSAIRLLKALQQQGLEISGCSPLLREILADGDPR